MARLDIQLAANNNISADVVQAIRLIKQARSLLEPARDNILQLVDTGDYSAVTTYLGGLDGGATPVDNDAFGQIIYNLINGAAADMNDGDLAALLDRVFE